MVDILLASYNGERFISRQIDSILGQSFGEWRLIVHDDGSSDNTCSIIEQYARSYQNRIVVINDDIKTGGAKNNFAHLMQYTTAPYVMFCDQDDVWLPNKIELSLHKMRETEALCASDTPILVHTDIAVVDEKLHVLDQSFWHFENWTPARNSLNRLLIQNTITGCATMINRHLLRKSLPIPQSAIMHDWWLGLVASAFGRIVSVHESSMLYRQHSTNDIGAVGFTYSVIYKKAFTIFKSNDLLARNIAQADSFLAQYKSELSHAHVEVLESLCRLKTESFFKQRFTLLRHRLLKQGVVRNVGLLLRV